MRNKYLILAASTALMFAACSDDITQGGNTNGNVSETKSLQLTTLDAATQAGRVTLPGETRGPKAQRLKLVAKIAPVEDLKTTNDRNWSATGVAIDGNYAYVSWHSNHQAKVSAEEWGGAIDKVSIAALEAKTGAVIVDTKISSRVKFNNVVAGGDGNLYFPLTCYINGAVVGRAAIDGETMDTIGIQGSSANAIAVKGSTLYAVTGYEGGAFSMPAAFNDDTKYRKADDTDPNRINVISALKKDFGGKYIANDYILRTDDTNSYLMSLDGTENVLGAPLTSAEKYAEAYDPANGEWYPVDENEPTAKHYGKHTMAISDGYIYVAGGKGANGENGLRVYDAARNLKWQNGQNTTAVCVSGDYVYAATGAGLRVYEKFNGTDLKLYAYEVKEYAADGSAIGHTGGTDAHSSNFVAVAPNGMIFVACGQSGLYVFQLDTTVAEDPVAEKAKLEIPSISHEEEKDADDSGKATFTIPETEPVPTEEGKEFDKWEDGSGNQYNPGDEITVEPGETATLTPVWKDHIYPYILKLDSNRSGATLDGKTLPIEIKSDDATITIPNADPVLGSDVFRGWSTTNDPYLALEPEKLMQKGATVTFSEEGTITIYALWLDYAEGDGGQGGDSGSGDAGNSEGGASDSGAGS